MSEDEKVWKYFECKNKNYVICIVCQELLYIGGFSKKEHQNTIQILNKKTKDKQIFIMKRHLRNRHPNWKQGIGMNRLHLIKQSLNNPPILLHNIP